MRIMDAYSVLEKYDKYDEVELEFKRKTVGYVGAMDLGLKLRIRAEFLDNKCRELKDKRLKLVKQKGKCSDFERIIKEEVSLHSECSFINIYPKKICEPCTFYQNNIKPIDKEIEMLESSAEYFRNKADYDDIWR